MHAFREQNEMVDFLEKMAKDGRRAWKEWATPLDEVIQAVQEDKRGILRIRRMLNTSS